MTKIILSNPAVHSIPNDVSNLLLSNNELVEKWNAITPLARNEWICWIDSAKKEETRRERIKRTKENLLAGKRRPCCWAGCPHRTTK